MDFPWIHDPSYKSQSHSTHGKTRSWNDWLVGGLNPSEKYESRLGWLFPIYGKIKNVPNHQPVGSVKIKTSSMKHSETSMIFSSSVLKRCLLQVTTCHLGVGHGQATGQSFCPADARKGFESLDASFKRYGVPNIWGKIPIQNGWWLGVPIMKTNS